MIALGVLRRRLTRKFTQKFNSRGWGLDSSIKYLCQERRTPLNPSQTRCRRRLGCTRRTRREMLSSIKKTSRNSSCPRRNRSNSSNKVQLIFHYTVSNKLYVRKLSYAHPNKAETVFTLFLFPLSTINNFRAQDSKILDAKLNMKMALQQIDEYVELGILPVAVKKSISWYFVW